MTKVSTVTKISPMPQMKVNGRFTGFTPPGGPEVERGDFRYCWVQKFKTIICLGIQPLSDSLPLSSYLLALPSFFLPLILSLYWPHSFLLQIRSLYLPTMIIISK